MDAHPSASDRACFGRRAPARIAQTAKVGVVCSGWPRGRAAVGRDRRLGGVTRTFPAMGVGQLGRDRRLRQRAPIVASATAARVRGGARHTQVPQLPDRPCGALQRQPARSTAAFRRGALEPGDIGVATGSAERALLVFAETAF